MSIKKLSSEVAIYGISSIAGRALSFLLLTPLLTNKFGQVLTTAEYGINSRLYSIVGLAAIFFVYRMELSYFRFGTENKEEENTAFNVAGLSIIFSTLFLGIILFFFADTIAHLLNYPDYGNLVRLAIGIIVIDALCEIPYAKLRLEQRPIRFATIRFTSLLINLGLNFFFLLFCPYALASETWSFLHPFLDKIYSAESALVYVFLSNILSNGVAFLLLSPTILAIKISQFDWSYWKKMMRYSIPLVIVGIAYILNESFDRMIMPAWLNGSVEENNTQLGIYSACYKLTMFLTLFNQAFRYGAEPFFFRQKTADNAKIIYAKVAKYIAIVGAIGFLSILLYVDILKQIIIGKEYWEGLKVVPILLLANLFLGLYYNVSIWYKLTDQTKWGAYISVIGALITISLNYFLIPIFGYMGAAWTTFACYLSMLLMSYFLGQRKYHVPYELSRIIAYISVAVLAYGFSEWIRPFVVDKMIVLLLVNSLILLIYLAFLGVMEKKDLMALTKK